MLQVYYYLVWTKNKYLPLYYRAIILFVNTFNDSIEYIVKLNTYYMK